MNEEKKVILISEKNGGLLAVAFVLNMLILVTSFWSDYGLVGIVFDISYAIILSIIEFWLWTRTDSVVYNNLYFAATLFSLEFYLLEHLIEDLLSFDLLSRIQYIAMLIIISILVVKKSKESVELTIHRWTMRIFASNENNISLTSVFCAFGVFALIVLKDGNNESLLFVGGAFVNLAMLFCISSFILVIFFWKRNKDSVEVRNFDEYMSENSEKSINCDVSAKE